MELACYHFTGLKIFILIGVKKKNIKNKLKYSNYV